MCVCVCVFRPNCNQRQRCGQAGANIGWLLTFGYVHVHKFGTHVCVCTCRP
jgi:hypothetical protein